MIKTQKKVLLVPEDTHYEYPEEVSTNSTAKKIANLTYGQLILCLGMEKNHEYQKYAAQELGKRSYTDPDACEQIYQEAGITDLVAILKPEKSLMLKYMSATALINIALDSQSRMDIATAGGVELLVNLLTITHPKTLDHAIWCLVNLTKDREMREEPIEAGVMTKLALILNPQDPKSKERYEKLLQDAGLRQRVAMLLCNLAEEAPRHHLQQFRKAGLLIPQLRWLLKYKADDETTRLVLATIFHVIQDVDNRNDFIKIGGLTFVTRFLFVTAQSHNLYIQLRILETLSLAQETHQALLSLTSDPKSPLQTTLIATLLSLLDSSPPHLLASAIALLANLSNSKLCREQIVSSNGVLLLCRLLNHEVEAVAAGACVIITNMAKEENIQEGIANLPSVPSALLRLTFAENRTETQALGLAGLKKYLSFQAFSLRFLAEGGAERLWKMGKMAHNTTLHELALSCITILIFTHPPSSPFSLPPSLTSDALLVYYDSLLPEVDLHIKYMALVGIKTLLRAGVEGGGGKIEKVEGEVNSLAELTGGKLENESARIAKELLLIFPTQKPPPQLSPALSFSSSLPPSAVSSSLDYLPPLDATLPPLDNTLPPLSENIGESVVAQSVEETIGEDSGKESNDAPVGGDSVVEGGSIEEKSSPGTGSGSSISTISGKITMKCAYEKVVKMMKVDASSSLSDLQKVLGQKFGIEITLIQYKDEDGDLISMETEDDMEFFVDTYNENPKKKFEVFVQGAKKQEAAPVQAGGPPPPPVVAGGPPPPPGPAAPPPPPPPGPPPPPSALKPKPVKLNIKKKSGSGGQAPKPKAASSAASFQDELRKRLEKGVNLKKVEQQAPRRRGVRKRQGSQQDMMSQLMSVLDDRRSKVKQEDDAAADDDDWDD